MLCILSGKMLYIYYRGIIFASEIKTNTNSNRPAQVVKVCDKKL